jgi:RimJ/RimL family protein N-acetyltransferase
MLTTARLTLRPFVPADAPFVVELLNDPDWLRFIGDRKVRTGDDAVAYIETKLAAQQTRFGYSLWRVAARSSDEPLGMCGLVRRAGLDEADIGFAFLARHRGRGYALEAARTVMRHADETLKIPRVLGLCDAANAPSIRLLEALGFQYAGECTLPNEAKPLRVYARARPVQGQ